MTQGSLLLSTLIHCLLPLTRDPLILESRSSHERLLLLSNCLKSPALLPLLAPDLPSRSPASLREWSENSLGVIKSKDRLHESVLRDMERERSSSFLSLSLCLMNDSQMERETARKRLRMPGRTKFFLFLSLPLVSVSRETREEKACEKEAANYRQPLASLLLMASASAFPTLSLSLWIC